VLQECWDSVPACRKKRGPRAARNGHAFSSERLELRPVKSLSTSLAALLSSHGRGGIGIPGEYHIDAFARCTTSLTQTLWEAAICIQIAFRIFDKEF